MNPAPATPLPLLQRSVRRGLTAARHNLIPGLIIAGASLALVIGYDQVPTVTVALNRVAEFRAALGLSFNALSSAFFGGIVPLLFQRLFLRERLSARPALFGILFWAYKGLEVGALYDLQAWLWGSGTDPATLAIKVFCDQFVYVPLLGGPTMVLGYLWMHQGFSLRRTREALGREGYWSRALPVLIANMALWIPVVTVVYMLPTVLQLPLENFILAIWVLLLAVLAREEPVPAGEGELIDPSPVGGRPPE